MSNTPSAPVSSTDAIPLTMVHEPQASISTNDIRSRLIREPHPKIMDILKEILKSHGHICVNIIGFKNHKFEWCEQDICVRVVARDQMRQRQEEERKFAGELREKGHTCIRIMESYPMQVGWCRNDICTGPRK